MFRLRASARNFCRGDACVVLRPIAGRGDPAGRPTTFRTPWVTVCITLTKFRKDNKRRIVLATDRPVSIAEAWRGGRSTDYAITMVELILDENNTGEGTLGFALKLKVNPETKQLEIENCGTDPVQLKGVRKAK